MKRASYLIQGVVVVLSVVIRADIVRGAGGDCADEMRVVEISPALTKSQSKLLLREVREFLWTHWSKQTEGKITVKLYSKEGQPWTEVYTVQPALREGWCIRVQVFEGSKTTPADSRQDECTPFVDREIVAPEKGDGTKRIGPDVVVGIDEFKLVLRDSMGDVLGEF